MSSIVMNPVKSSMISEIGYNPTAWTLHILFTNGLRYRYSNVFQFFFVDLMTAQSKGEFFNKFIKPNFKATKIDDYTR